MIVAAGCSFTASDFRSHVYKDYDVSYPKWPEIVAGHLKTDLVNFAKCGYGNDYIVDKMVPFILNNYKDIHLVVIGWTEALRFNIYHQHHFNPTHWLNGNDSDPYSNAYKFLNTPYSVAQRIMRETDLDVMADKLEEEYSTLISLCKHLNLKYIFGQTLRPIDYDKINYIFKDLNIDESNFIGHPIYDLSIYEIMSHDINRYTIGEDDRHPNAEGHRMIANLYIKKYGELYGKE